VITADAERAAASGRSASDHAARYESLRAYTVERHATSSRDGLVVLLRQGVAAWMQAWSKLPAPPPRPAAGERQPPSSLPDDATTQVVRILATMTLSHIQEVHA
jgi:hypothetical protein